jgi:hypothetical protein
MNSQRLEKMEERLKADVVKESAKFGGLVLVHQELCKTYFYFIFQYRDGIPKLTQILWSLFF